MNKLLQAFHKFGKLSLPPLLMILTFVYAMFQGGFVSWFVFYSFLPFGLYSFLLPFLSLQMIEVKRITNQREYAAGEKFISTITIERQVPFPLLYLVIEDMLPSGLKNRKQAKAAKAILFPWFKRRISYEYEFDALPRGEHIFSAVRVKTGDLFGLAEKEVTFSVPDTFLVYPHYVDMAYKQLENRFEQGTASANINIGRDATVSVGVRDYKPGDRFSWIDWKTSARKQHIMTKEFEQQQSHDVLIFMDRTESPLFEPAVTFTASLVRAILKKGAQISFVSVGKERTVFPLQNGGVQQQQIFYHLAKVQPDAAISFSQIVETELKKVYQPVTFMFVTNVLTPHIEKAAERITMKKGNLLVFVVKEKAAQFSNQEISILESMRKRNIIVKPVYEGHYSNVFFEVNGA